MKRALSLFLVLLLCTCLMASCGSGTSNPSSTSPPLEASPADLSTPSSEENEPVAKPSALTPVNIGYMPIPGNALFMIAEEKGFFEEEGLDVELLMFKASGEGVPALADGKLDTGCFGTTAIMSRIAQGDDITIYGGQMSEGSGIVTLPENQEFLSDFANYKGKKLGVVRMTTGDVLFRYALIQAGLTIGEDVEVIELDSPATLIEAIKKGEIDAGGVWIPHLANAEANGLAVAVFSGDVLRTHPCARMVAMTDRMKQDPELFIKIQKACIKAYEVYQNNQDESVDLMLKYIDLDRDVLAKEAYRNFSTSPSPNANGNIEFWTEMKAIGYIDSELDIKNFIDVDTYRTALEQVMAENPDVAFYKELQNSSVQAEQ